LVFRSSVCSAVGGFRFLNWVFATVFIAGHPLEKQSNQVGHLY
jgi:hypothetical protein